MRPELLPVCACTVLWPVSLALGQDATTSPASTPEPMVEAATPTTSDSTAPKAIELASVPIDIVPFIMAGPQVFDIAMNATNENEAGSLSFTSTLVMETELRDDGFMLKDHWEIMGREYDLTMRCGKESPLPLLGATVEMTRMGHTETATCTVENNVLKMTAGERTAELDYPAGTVLQSAVFRIVTQLPTTPGQQFTFPSCTEPLEMKVMQPPAGQTFNITCVGNEIIAVTDAEIECTKFTLNVDKPVDFFVDGDSKLRKVVADNGAMVMMLREGVMAASESDQ